MRLIPMLVILTKQKLFLIFVIFGYQSLSSRQLWYWIVFNSGLDYSSSCIHSVLEVMNFTNSRTWSSFDKYVHERTFSISRVREAVAGSCSVRKGVLRNFAKFTGKHLCQSLFLNKVAGLWHRCFPVNFAKFLRTPFRTEHPRWLLLWVREAFLRN